MKKLITFITTLSLAFGVIATPAVVLAQTDPDIPTVVVGTSDASTADTTTSTAGVPDTGVAPQPSALTRNLVVFTVGGTIGALLAISTIAVTKRVRTQK